MNGYPPIDSKERQKVLEEGNDDPLTLLEVKEGYFQTFYTFVNQALSMVEEEKTFFLVKSTIITESQRDNK